mgnify:CR=1 FL=1
MHHTVFTGGVAIVSPVAVVNHYMGVVSVYDRIAGFQAACIKWQHLNALASGIGNQDAHAVYMPLTL